MEVTGEGASVYAEAKGEYTRQLCQYLVPAIHKYFLEILDNAKEQEPEVKKQLLQFQTLLEGISEWNVDKVQRETQRILISTQCDYIEELLTAVFIAHTKVLSAIRLTNKQKKLQITIPKLEHFLHRTLTECARHLWTNTFLFSSSYSPLERQKNMRQIEGLISEGVLQGVRTMLPVKSILREYLAAEDTESEYETDSESEEEEEEEEKPKVEKPKVEKSKVEPVEPIDKDDKPLDKDDKPLDKDDKHVEPIERVHTPKAVKVTFEDKEDKEKEEDLKVAVDAPILNLEKAVPEENLIEDVELDNMGFEDVEVAEDMSFEFEEIL